MLKKQRAECIGQRAKNEVQDPRLENLAVGGGDCRKAF
jgi:hypothetical protein